jgi:hypothetical protein
MRRRSLIPTNLRRLRFVGIRDDRLFWGKMWGKEAASRSSILDKWRIGTFAARRFFPSVSQLNTCHPDAKRGISISFQHLTYLQIWWKIRVSPEVIHIAPQKVVPLFNPFRIYYHFTSPWIINCKSDLWDSTGKTVIKFILWCSK